VAFLLVIQTTIFLSCFTYSFWQSITLMVKAKMVYSLYSMDILETKQQIFARKIFPNFYNRNVTLSKVETPVIQ
jgi:hypothetical protein